VVLNHRLRDGNRQPMTLITFQDGKVVFRDGKVGTEEACCCGGEEEEDCGSEYDHCVVNTAANNSGPFVVGCAEFGDESSSGSRAGNLCRSDFMSVGCDPFIPTGWQWAAGYPEAFGNCRFVFVQSFSTNTVACEGGGGCAYTRGSFRVWKLTPAGTLVDVTAEAAADGLALIQDLTQPFSGCTECSEGDFPDPGECTPQLICGACCLDENLVPEEDQCFENVSPYDCENSFFGSFAGGFKLNERCADNPCEEPPP
jgi:hypothetical protein